MGSVGYMELILMLIPLAIIYVPLTFYCLTLTKCLKLVQPENQAISPGLVWLSLIPIFQIGWNFYLVIKMKESLENEYRYRNLKNTDNFSFALGMTMSGLFAASVIPFVIIVGLILWIIYWVKMNGYKNELLANSNNYLYYQ